MRISDTMDSFTYVPTIHEGLCKVLAIEWWAKQGFSFMKYNVFGEAYNKQVNKHKNTAMNCDTCNKGNDQNTMVENIT